MHSNVISRGWSLQPEKPREFLLKPALDLRRTKEHMNNKTPHFPKRPKNRHLYTTTHTRRIYRPKKNVELNDNEHFTHQNLWDSMKAVFRDRVIVLYV